MTPFTLVSGDFVMTGGMDRANFALADYLSRTGWPLTLVAHRAEPELAARPNVTLRRVPKPLGSNLLGSWPLARAGERAARAGGRVVVNGGNCRVADVNWVHYLHAAYNPNTTGVARRLKAAVERPLNLRAERAALAVARVVVCNSERTREDAIRLAGVRPERAVTVYLATDPTRFRPPAPDEREELRRQLGWPVDCPVVMFIGALGDRRKGFDTLFAAWGELCRASGWDAMLVVVGRGAELPVWEGRSQSAGLDGRVHFLGYRSDVPDLLRAADLLVSPTRYEAYGMGVHEAICCGLPAVVSADAGVAERYPPGLTEWLLHDPDDARELATILSRWRASAGSTRDRFAGFSAALRSYSWDDMARVFLSVVGETPA